VGLPGRQRASRLMVSQLPRRAPWARSACAAYSEQVGVKWQHGGRRGLISRWYVRMPATSSDVSCDPAVAGLRRSVRASPIRATVSWGTASSATTRQLPLRLSQTASGVEQAGVTQTGPADWPRPVWIAVVVVASASEARHPSSVHTCAAHGVRQRCPMNIITTSSWAANCDKTH
jgi:hypothetical protein